MFLFSPFTLPMLATAETDTWLGVCLYARYYVHRYYSLEDQEKPFLGREFVPNLTPFCLPGTLNLLGWECDNPVCSSTSTFQNNEIEYKIRRCLNTEMLVSFYLQSCVKVNKGFTLQFICFLVLHVIQKPTSFKSGVMKSFQKSPGSRGKMVLTVRISIVPVSIRSSNLDGCWRRNGEPRQAQITYS